MAAIIGIRSEAGIFVTKVLQPGQLTQVLGSAEVRAKWKVAAFLNSVSEAEALALYREHG